MRGGGMSEKKQKVEYKGRKKIYTDASEITDKNVLDVLAETMVTHMKNREQINYLVNYEKGHQPLQRPKKTRTEIDVQCVSNLAHRIAEFHISYQWGNHMAFVQKSDKHPKGNDSASDDSAITIFNEMYEAEGMERKDQKLAYFVEVCGVCPQLIDVKRDYEDGDSAFDLVTLDPDYAYVVYSSDAYERPMMGVSYSEDEMGNRLFSCVTKDVVYTVKNRTEIVDGKKKETYGFHPEDNKGVRNLFGEINIIECERASDRTGVFERQIDQMNALNILESDAVNSVSQAVQSVWLVLDLEFEKDDEGNPIPPVDGQWILSKTNANSGQKPDIKPLVMPLDYQGVLSDIENKREEILENAFCPVQKDQSGGATTGATSLSNGWAIAEAVATKEAQFIKDFYRRRNRLALKAIKLQPEEVPSELLELKNSDIDIRPIRQKTFDMATKVNSLATMLNCMVHPRDAMAAIDFFPNLAETVEDSIDMMLKYQKKLAEGGTQAEARMEQVVPNTPGDMETVDGGIDRNMADSSDRAGQSPLSDL